jgi:hypothetical protein
MEQPVIRQAIASVGIRPRRLAYMIRSGDRDQFLRAISYATTEWGGMGHPILQVQPNGRIAEWLWQIAEVTGPEVLIDYSGIEEARDQARDRLGSQVIDEPREGLMEPGAHALVAVPGRSLDGKRIAMGNYGSLLERVALGVIPDAQRSMYEQAGGVLEDTIDERRALHAQLHLESLIGLTLWEFPALRASGIYTDIVYVFCYPRLTTQQAIWFWNCRALSVPPFGRTRLVLAHQRSLRSMQAAAALQDACLAKLPTDPDLFFGGSSPDELRKLATSLGLKESKTKRISMSFSSSERNLTEAPLTYRINVDPRALVMGERVGGKRRTLPIVISGNSLTLHLSSPVDFNYRVGGHVRFDVEGIDSLDLPRRSAVASLIHDNATFTSHGLSLITSPNRTYDFTLRIPSSASVTSAMLEEIGWQWTPSDKGRYARALLSESAGTDRIAILQSSSAYRLVGQLVSLTSRKAEAIVKRVARVRGLSDEDKRQLVSRALTVATPVWKSANEIASQLRSRKGPVLADLGELVRCGLVRRGLQFSCAICGMPNVFPLGQEGDMVECPGCGTIAPLIGPSAAEPTFLYALNSLLDRAMDQDVIPHLLALEYLTTHNEAIWGYPGADITGPNEEGRELDILAISRTGLVVGELKPADRFTHQVIDDAVELAHRLKAEAVVLGSLTRWSQRRRSHAETVARRAQLKLILLDRELLRD